MRRGAEPHRPTRSGVGPARTRAAGFTILEVLVGMALLSGAAVLSGHAMTSLLSVVGSSGDLTVAAHLGVAKLEEIRSGVEAQTTRDTWNATFDAIAPQARMPFAAPLSDYAYEVNVDEVIDPAAACWMPSGPGAGCTPAHDNMIKWITVRVYHRERLRAEVTSAVIRGMWRRN